MNLKYFIIPFTLIFSLSLFSEELVVLSTGQTIIVNDDHTWEEVEIPRDRIEPVMEMNYQGILIKTIEAKVFESYLSGQQAGLQFSIRNNSSKAVTKLKIIVYFLDKNGIPFFEEDYILVNNDSWTDQKILKPNYLFRYPESDTKYAVAEGLDLTEWDVGQIVLEMDEIVFSEE